MTPEVQITNDRLQIEFCAPFDIEAYKLFLKCKKLPEHRLRYSEELDTYTIDTPARFAAILGLEGPTTLGESLPIPEFHFEHQREIAKLALDAKRFAVWSDCGTGKTLVELEFGRQVMSLTDRRVLIITLNEIVDQTIEESRKFYGDGLQLHRIETRQEMREWCNGETPELGITNYEKMNPDDQGQIVNEMRHLGGLILDECFTPDTLIDTPKGQRPIRDIRVGDEFYNAVGIDHVSDVHRREVKYGIKLTFNGRSVISSPNHPYLTQRGWVGAQDLEPGDYLIPTAEAVRILWPVILGSLSLSREGALLQSSLCGQMANGSTGSQGEFGGERKEASSLQGLPVLRQPFSPSLEKSRQKVLQSILFSEMVDEPAGACGQSSQSRGAREDWQGCQGLAGIGGAFGGESDRPYSESKSDIRSGDLSENLPKIERDEPQTFRAWGQWNGHDYTSADFTGCSVRQLESGICFITGAANSRLSHELQTRLRESRSQNRHRGGWQHSPLTESERPQEGCETGFIRVDSLEVLESGHPELERYRDADGSLYFYDLGGTRHPSFSVNAALVHNSSRLKAGGGKQKWALIHSSKGIPYKLSCTATPAPNDVIEFASQASFLERMRNDNEIIWTFFTRDPETQEWTVKRHARAAFFEWMAAWSIYLRDPRRYGWSSDIELPPEPEILYHKIDMTPAQVEAMKQHNTDRDGQIGLFASKPQGIVVRGKFSQIAKGFIYQDGGAERIESLKPAAVTGWIIAEYHRDLNPLIWTVFDEESEIIAEHLRAKNFTRFAVLSGSTPKAKRQPILDAYRRGETPVLISKASLLGYGMNFQHCGSMIFSGWNDSFEQLYQAIRRAVRYGQKRSVRVHFPYIEELEGPQLDTVFRKARQFEEIITEQETAYIAAMRRLNLLKGGVAA